MNIDRYTKFVLTALAVGVWALVLKPSFQPTPAEAQSKGGIQRVVYGYKTYDIAMCRNEAEANRAEKELNSGEWHVVSVGWDGRGLIMVLGKP